MELSVLSMIFATSTTMLLPLFYTMRSKSCREEMEINLVYRKKNFQYKKLAKYWAGIQIFSCLCLNAGTIFIILFPLVCIYSLLCLFTIFIFNIKPYEKEDYDKFKSKYKEDHISYSRDKKIKKILK